MLFGKLILSATMPFLLYFLLSSRFVLPKKQNWKHIICWIGCCLLLWLDHHWIMQIGAAFCAAFFIAWYIGCAAFSEAFSFGMMFAILRFAAAAVTFGVSLTITDLSDVSVTVLDTALLFALVAAASVVKSRWTDTPMPALRLLPIWLVSLLLCGEIIRHRSWADVSLMEAFSCLWQLYTIIPLLQVRNNMEKAQQAFVSQQEKAYHYAIQEEYYRKLRSKQEETRALWHDLNKYLRAAKAETDSAEALNRLESMLNSAMEIVDVGNPVLNVILNEYAMTAKAAGIELRMKVQVPEHLDLAAADLYVIIGNTMDNAIEACKALPAEERLIDLVFRTRHDIVFYQLTNPCAANAPKHSSDPLRGYGLKNVSRCVEQYNGSMESVQQDGYFTVTVHLNQSIQNAAGQ